MHQDPGKKPRPHNRLGQTYLLVLEGLLWRWGWRLWLTAGTGTLAVVVLGSFHWHEPSGRLPLSHQDLSPPKACRRQCWEASGQIIKRVGIQPPHQETDCSMSSWAQSCPLNTAPDTALPTSTHRWANVSPHRRKPAPLKQPHLPGGQQQKQEELQPCSLSNGSCNRRESTKWQRTMFQMNEQDKMPGQKLIEGEIGNLPKKEFGVMKEKIIQDLRKRMEARARIYEERSYA